MGAIKNCPKLRDVIYGRPLREQSDYLYFKIFIKLGKEMRKNADLNGCAILRKTFRSHF